MTLPVVYLFGPPNRVDTDELRWSLRALQNFPHTEVWIVGWAPAWVDRDRVRVLEVQHTPRGVPEDKHRATTANLEALCQASDAPERFTLFNDDFFVMAPGAGAPMLHRGPLRAEVERIAPLAGPRSFWLEAHRNTLDVLDEVGIPHPVSYELHVPLVVNTATLAAALDAARGRLVCKRTVYGNLAHCGGVRAEDVKIRSTQGRWDGSSRFVSTSELSFRYGPVGRQIRAAFPAASPYEDCRVPAVPSR